MNSSIANKRRFHAKHKKYVEGKQIESLAEFIERLEYGLPFYWRHKFMATGFIEHWSIAMIKNSIQ